jgi:formylglycine-generating enzyme required for sulfatase activity
MFILEEEIIKAGIGAVMKIAADLGVVDPVRELRAQLKKSEKQHTLAFEKAYEGAVKALGDDLTEAQQALFKHRPFLDAVLAGLLDPAAGLDLNAAARDWSGALPAANEVLRRFFRNLKNTLTQDPYWGELLVRYQTLREQPELDGQVDDLKILREVKINTQGGAYIGGNVDTQGGDFNARDQYKQTGDHATMIIHQETPVVAGRVELRTYFRALAKECGDLPLGIFDEKFTSRDAILLKDVYIDLDVLGVRLDGKKELHLLRRELERPQEGEKQERIALITAIGGEKVQRMARRKVAMPKVGARDSLKVLAHKTRRMVLLGAAGSGKTTFTNYLTHQLARDYTEGRVSWGLPKTLRGLLPVRLLLRKVAAHIPLDAGCGQAEMLWNALEEDLKNRLGSGYGPAWEWLRQEMGAGRSLVLLDGLDEVPEAGQRRACLLQAVEAFLSGLPQTQRVVLTARPYAYANPAWQLKGCYVFNLAPLNSEQVGRFVEQWYLSVRGSVNLDEDEATQRARQLAAVIEARSYLGDLASRPLLLTLMAALHSTGDDLPEDRADLYEKTIHLLLARWQQKKEAVQIDLMFVRQALSELAYQTHKRQRGERETEGPGDIPFGDLLACFYVRQPQISLKDLTAYLEDRTGLLVEREPKLYCFAHRSFQEYLAACYLLDTSPDFSEDVHRLVEEDPAWWREVILLAMGKARQGGEVRALDLLRSALLPMELGGKECPRPSVSDWRAAALGAQALLELRILERQPKQAEAPKNVPRARDWLVGLMEKSNLPARERVEAGNALAALGDQRFDAERWYLPKDEMVGFVRIPGGVFRMGSDPERDPQSADREQPQHSVEVSEFYIQRYPVTVAQFGMFVGQSGYSPRDPDCLKGAANHPVVNVDWKDAVAYCAWLDGKLRENGPQDLRRRLEQGWQVRLPSEAEWEKAARGTDGRIYPWGDEFDPDKANLESVIGGTSPVGSFPGDLSPYGVLDMAGNVWEWCSDWYDEKAYAGRAGKLVRDPRGPEKGESRTLRGGSWGSLTWDARCASRYGGAPDLFDGRIGFRLVLSLAFSGF